MLIRSRNNKRMEDAEFTVVSQPESRSIGRVSWSAETVRLINDDRTKFCRKAMKANDGVWNPVTSAWMFTKRGRSRERDVRTPSGDTSERGAARDAALDGRRRHRHASVGFRS